MGPRYAHVIVDVPLVQPLDYALDNANAVRLQTGVRCVVPLGRGARVGIAVGTSDRPTIDPARIKPVNCVLDEIVPLSHAWLQLTRFAAEYYQHAWGEVAIPALPRALRSLPGPRYARAIARLRERSVARWTQSGAPPIKST